MRTFTQSESDPTFFTEDETGAIFITRPDQSIESLLEEIANPPALVPTTDEIDTERNRRTTETFKFKNRLYQLRPSDVQNITGAALAATLAIMNGATPGDLRWFDPDKDFEWIATNNNTVTMDAQTVVEFANAAMAWRSRLIFIARSIKDRLLSGETLDIYDDTLWSDPV